MKRIAAIGMISGTLVAHGRLPGSTELLNSDQSKAHSGHSLFAARGASNLLDIEGKVIYTKATGTYRQ